MWSWRHHAACICTPIATAFGISARFGISMQVSTSTGATCIPDDYFAEQKTLLGSSPFNTQTGVSQFFTAMFQNEQFVAQFKAHWDSVKTKLLPMIFTKLDNYKLQIEEAKLNDSELWPIGKNFDTEYQRLQNWLTARLSVMDANIQKYSATSSGGRGN